MTFDLDKFMNLFNTEERYRESVKYRIIKYEKANRKSKTHIDRKREKIKNEKVEVGVKRERLVERKREETDVSRVEVLWHCFGLSTFHLFTHTNVGARVQKCTYSLVHAT